MSSAKEQTDRRPGRQLMLLGWAMCLVFVISVTLWERTDGRLLRERPILLVLSMYWVAFAMAIVALRVAVKARSGRRLVPIVFAFAISFRLIQLFATPFLEIDAYRYMWDGIVTSNGISPYAWSPAQARTDSQEIPEAQRGIVDLANSTESIRKIVTTVHFPKYRTIYPPVSQAVFAVTMWIVPDSASPRTHLIAMKLALVLFDIATLFLLLKALQLTRLSPGWVVAYAWNPLVIKEIANSGHLDAIAVFFVVAATFALMRELKQHRACRVPVAVLSASLLAMGVGAKLFPAVLVPLFCLWIWERNRKAAVAFALSVAVGTCAVMAPMLLAQPGDPTDSRDGLTGFLSQWRMNALAFDLVYENARLPGKHVEPWYSIAPTRLRESWLSIADRLPGALPGATKLARGVTLSIFGVLYLVVLARTRRRVDDVSQLPTAIFFVLTSFLLLQPTLNPWYWVWVLPFVCFVRNVGWHIVGAGLLLYYARFWFKSSGTTFRLGETVYANADCFDHFVVWVEHALFVVCVVALRRVEFAGESWANNTNPES